MSSSLRKRGIKSNEAEYNTIGWTHVLDASRGIAGLSEAGLAVDLRTGVGGGGGSSWRDG